MIEINGKKYARNDKEFTETLFTSGTTAFGYYKRFKNRIILRNMQGKTFAALVKNSDGAHLVNASEIDGRTRYQFGLSSINAELFGVPSGYMAGIEYVEKLANDLI